MMMVDSSVMLYEILNIRSSESIDDFGEEILDKCSRIIGANRIYLKIKDFKHFILGFRNAIEAEKEIKKAKKSSKGNIYIREFENGIFYIETPERIDCELRRIISSLSKRVEEVVDRYLAEITKIELEKLRVLVNSIPDAVTVIDSCGKIVDFNIKFIETSKLPAHEVINRKIYELQCFSEDGREKLLEVIKSGLKKAKVTLKINNLYMELNIAKITDSEKYIIIFRDITNIITTSKRFQKLVDCLRNFIFMKDKNLRYILVNDSFSRFLGLPKDEIIGKRDMEVLPPELAKMCEKTDMEILRSKKSKSFEVEIKRNGKVMFFEGYKVPVFSGEDVTSIVGVIRDVTEKRIIEELKRFKTLLDYSSDAIFIVKTDGEIVDANEEAKKWTELCGSNNVKDIIHGDWKLEEFEGQVFDGKFVSVNVKSAKFGEKDYRIVIARDITEIKKMNERIKEMNEQLRLMNSLLRHDISNNITAMLGFMELYKETKDQKYLEKVESLINRCTEIISSVREAEIALYEDRELSLIDIRKVLLEAVERIKRDDVKISINVGKSCCLVVADDFVYSVFENLLNNAVQHNPKDMKEIYIELKCFKDFAEVKIADNGLGIMDEIKELIFERGFKFSGTGRTGMGLYIVKSLMERYGGNVEVKDNKPEGTVFILKFKKEFN